MNLTTVQKALLSILGAQLVLIVFFGAFKFEKITLFLYSGTWVGIGVARYLLYRAQWLTQVKIVAAIFGIQIVAFAGLDLAHMNDLLLEEIGFLSIGVWTGILIGTLLGVIEDLERKLAACERADADSERE